MKKKLIIRSGNLRMGGLERVLVEVVQNIDLSKYDVSLFIEDDSGKENIFYTDIPKEIKIYFLKPEKILRKTESYKKKKKNIIYKILYNYMMYKERKITIKNTIENIKKIGEIDVFIDFDWGAVKYIEKLPIKKSIVWVHNSIPNLLQGRKGKIKRLGKNISKYDKIVVICDEMKAELQKIYPYINKKIERIYNPFNFERIKRQSEDDTELNIDQKELLKERYCVAVSRLDTVQKDYETLLKSFAGVREKIEDLKLFIVGDGPNRDEVEHMIEKYKLEGKVKLLGLQKNPYIWMKNSQFFIHSSKYEGFGLVLVEAMILGKAVISSDCQVGPNEILENGKSGILYPVGDTVKLEHIFQEVIRDKEILKKYEEKSKKRAEDFNKDIIIKQYEKIIDSLI